MRIRAFSTGRVRQKRGTRGIRRYFAEDWSDETLPVNVFLIEHPEGLCLVDTGQTAEATRPGYFDRWYPFFRLSRFELSAVDEVAAQLAATGFSPSDVRWVVLTHMHTDHVGGVRAFTESEVVVNRDEWQPAQGLMGRLRGYQPQHWPRGIGPRVVDLSGPGVGPFVRSYDVVGDGSVLMVPLPGHTLGHTGLLVLEHGEPRWLGGGDAAQGVEEFESSHPEVASWCRDQGVEVLLAHDDVALRRFGGGREDAT